MRNRGGRKEEGRRKQREREEERRRKDEDGMGTEWRRNRRGRELEGQVARRSE